MFDSDTESEVKLTVQCWGMLLSLLQKSWTEGNMSRKLEDFTGVSGVTIECNSPQSVSEIKELIFGWPKEKLPAKSISFCKNPVVNELMS